MKIAVHFAGNEYHFIDESGTELYTGRIKSGRAVCGLNKELKAANSDHVCYATDHEIRIGNQTTMLFYTLERTWECVGTNLDYFLVPHKGNKTSIFKGKNQVGYYVKAKSYSATSAFISLEMNRDCDFELILSLVFALECNFEDREAIILYHGWGGKEYRKFDNDWLPN